MNFSKIESYVPSENYLTVIERHRWKDTRKIVEKFTGKDFSKYQDWLMETGYFGTEPTEEHNGLSVHFDGNRYVLKNFGKESVITELGDYSSRRHLTEEELERIEKMVGKSGDEKAKKIFSEFMKNREDCLKKKAEKLYSKCAIENISTE